MKLSCILGIFSFLLNQLLKFLVVVTIERDSETVKAEFFFMSNFIRRVNKRQEKSGKEFIIILLANFKNNYLFQTCYNTIKILK